jgi:hypothetical protein
MPVSEASHDKVEGTIARASIDRGPHAPVKH